MIAYRSKVNVVLWFRGAVALSVVKVDYPHSVNCGIYRLQPLKNNPASEPNTNCGDFTVVLHLGILGLQYDVLLD